MVEIVYIHFIYIFKKVAKGFLILIFCFLFGSRSHANSIDTLPLDTLETSHSRHSKSFMLQLEQESGGFIPNNTEIKDLSKSMYYNGVNLKMGWRFTSDNIYNKIYNYPTYGIGFYGSTLGMEEFGHPLAVFGFVVIPIKPQTQSRWSFNYRISLGISGNFRPYDEAYNPLNILIGSRQNVYIDLGIQAHYRLGKSFQLGTGFAFHHFSNGATKLPNKGINLIPWTLSLTYIPKFHTLDYSRNNIPQHQKDHQIHVNYSWGIKQLTLDNPKLYQKSTLGLYISESFGYKWRLGLGFDAFYSESGKYKSIAHAKAGKIGSLISSAAAFYIDHVLHKNLYINANVGFYIHRNKFNGEINPYYLRIGTRYNILRNTYAGVSIKAHAGKADFVEWTVGHSFMRK